MTPEQIYKRLDRATEGVVLHGTALLNHSDTTAAARMQTKELLASVRRRDAGLYREFRPTHK